MNIFHHVNFCAHGSVSYDTHKYWSTDFSCMSAELQLKTGQGDGLNPKAEDIDGLNSNRRKGPFRSVDRLQKLDEQKKWLDEEVEKVLNQCQELEMLEEDLKRLEALLREKSHLENKKLRSSQALSTDSLKISARLNLLDQELLEKSLQLENSTAEGKIKSWEQVRALQQEKEQLQRQKDSVDKKLSSGRVLSPSIRPAAQGTMPLTVAWALLHQGKSKTVTHRAEHRLFQLEEGIEALEAAIEFKSESIQCRQNSLKDFNKVMNLQEAEQKQQLLNKEMEMKVLEWDNIVRELESALEHVRLQCDRRLAVQQEEHEHKMQLLLRHFKEPDGEGIIGTFKKYEDKIQQLEKDLSFYKKPRKHELLLIHRQQTQQTQRWHRDAGDGVLNPEEAAVLSEEVKRASRTQSTKLDGGETEIDNCSSGLKTQPLPQKILEDGADSRPVCGSSAPSIGQLLSNADKPEAHPFAQFQSPPPSQFQPLRSIGQLQGVKPVKLCRRELRQISAVGLSLCRSSLGAGVPSVTANSLEVYEEA